MVGLEASSSRLARPDAPCRRRERTMAASVDVIVVDFVGLWVPSILAAGAFWIVAMRRDR
jgi:hypothetical protein